GFSRDWSSDVCSSDLGSVAGGEHALMFSSNRQFSDGEWERMHAMLDRIYDDFTAKVAEGRNLDRSAVEDVARGRVWTGADAKERSEGRGGGKGGGSGG